MVANIHIKTDTASNEYCKFQLPEKDYSIRRCGKWIKNNYLCCILAVGDSESEKQRREAMLEFEKGNRQDLLEQSKAEVEILLKYLPQQLSEDEIKQLVKDSAEEVGANSIKDMGKVMSVLRPKTVGKADGKLVSQIVKEYLNNK